MTHSITNAISSKWHILNCINTQTNIIIARIIIMDQFSLQAMERKGMHIRVLGICFHKRYIYNQFPKIRKGFYINSYKVVSNQYKITRKAVDNFEQKETTYLICNINCCRCWLYSGRSKSDVSVAQYGSGSRSISEIILRRFRR